VWPELDLTEDQTRQIAELCRRVPYFGRSTCPTLVELVDTPPAEPALLPEAAVPTERFRLETVVRSPFPGSLLALRNAYQRRLLEGGEGGDVWEIGDRIGYGSESEPLGEGELQSPFRQLVTFSIENRYLDGRHAARLTHAFRRAILSRASQPLPALHGHHDGTVVQCAYLALPDVGGQHSDGHILGVALAVPQLSPPELAVVANAVDTPYLDLTAGPLGVLRLKRLRPIEAQVAWGLHSRRWQKAAERWATALPMVFDRFPGKGADLGPEVRRSVVNAGFPEPVRLGWSRRPFVPGGVSMAPRDTLRRPGDTPIRPFRHVWFEFDKKVQGPVVVGSMRHYGLGLCLPIEREPGDASEA
jgi:CRISPR-associated protein Csb2